VLNLEQDPDSKAHLLTKIAGNFKKQEKSNECIDSARQAFDLLKAARGNTDI